MSVADQAPTPGPAPGQVDPSWPPPRPDRGAVDARRARPVKEYAVDAVVILGVMAALGVVGGFVWSQVVDPAQLIRFDNAVGQDELQLGKVFGADGWYFTIAAVSALMAGVGLVFWRTGDLLATVLLLLAGCVAAAALMSWTGHAFGPDDPSVMLSKAAVGTTADAPLKVNAEVVYLAWPIFALAGALLPLLTRHE